MSATHVQAKMSATHVRFPQQGNQVDPDDDSTDADPTGSDTDAVRFRKCIADDIKQIIRSAGCVTELATGLSKADLDQLNAKFAYHFRAQSRYPRRRDSAPSECHATLGDVEPICHRVKEVTSVSEFKWNARRQANLNLGVLRQERKRQDGRNN